MGDLKNGKIYYLSVFWSSLDYCDGGRQNSWGWKITRRYFYQEREFQLLFSFNDLYFVKRHHKCGHVLVWEKMRKNLVLGLILTTTLGIVAAVAAIDKNNSSPPEQVRVAIVRDSRELDLAIHGRYRLRDMSSGKVIGHGAYLVASKVRLLDRGILVGLDVYPSKRLTIEPARDASIIIDERAFRGEVTFIRTADNRITVVNNINVEDYIKGVLYHEVSHHWPMEALKAQAVAARTYALYSINPAGKPYDVTNDIYSQVYGGRDSERYRTDLAVNYTRNEVLTYNNKIIPAYFHATCGGMTEDARELWKSLPDIPPLRGVPCGFCQTSPHMHWKKNFRLKSIQDTLNLHGYKVGAIKDISVVERDRSDRIEHLKITQKSGEDLIIKGKDFRDIMGPNVLMSNNYEITMRGYYVDLTGKGWGHGVGMCQWGALGMARQQFNYKQILAYYYPQSVLMDYHDLRNHPSSNLSINQSYFYQLPDDLIAQEPVADRDHARLLIIDRKLGSIRHDTFDHLNEYLPRNSHLVVNNSKVIPARLLGHRASGGAVEVFLLNPLEDGYSFEVLLRPLKKIREGEEIDFGKSINATLENKEKRIVRFNKKNIIRHLKDVGHIPLPPYIKRTDTLRDREDYQTVYAKQPGSVASPTAGLHFTGALIKKLKSQGHRFLELTLHINYGTFKPVECLDIRNHPMHTEQYSIKPAVYQIF